MPVTSVAVYRIASDGSTGELFGLGVLVDPAVVFLHRAAGVALVQGPPRRALAVPAPRDLLQPVEQVGRRRPGPSGRRLRCQIRSDIDLTLDGTLLDQAAGVDAPRAISLDGTFPGAFDEVTLPQGPGHPTAQEAADAIDGLLDEAEQGLPTRGLEPPSGADQGGPFPHEGKRPWYCVICPGAIGC